MTVKISGDALSILARLNFSKNVNSLSDSVEKLSSGLRINSYADDPATSTIASNLNNQALSLGQAVKNANDAVSIMQIVDDSINEATDIVSSIRTKAVQASQEAVTSSTRESLQDDINVLLEELDTIIDASEFNDQKILNGVFLNKSLQTGVSPTSDVIVDFPSAKEAKIGQLGTGVLTLSTSTGGSVSFNFTNSDTDETLSINSMVISHSNDSDNGMGGLADFINQYTTDTGISAVAEVESESSSAITSGTTPSTFAINDISIGAVTVQALDADSRLINAINSKTLNHGVKASISSSGQLVLNSSDGRTVKVSNIGDDIGTSDEELSTYGQLNILQTGSYTLNLSDLSEGFAVAFSENMQISKSVTTTQDSTMETGSVLGSGSTLAAGFTLGAQLSGSQLNTSIQTEQSSVLLTGSVIASGSTIASGSAVGGTATVAGSVLTTAYSVLQSESTLKSGSVIKSGSYLTNDITTASGPVLTGTVLTGDATLTSDVVLTSDMMLLSGSTIAENTILKAGSTVGGDYTLSGALTLTQDMTLLADSTLEDVDGVTLIAAGSTVGGNATLSSAVTMTQSMSIKAGSVLSADSEISTGSTLGGSSILEGTHTAIDDVLIESGSTLAVNSVIKSGTLITSQLQTTNGTVSSGTSIDSDVTTQGANTLSASMLVKSGSALATGSTLAANTNNSAAVELSSESSLKLINLSVLTARDASIAVVIADAALADLEKVRADAAAYQDQFESSISLLGDTQMQLSEARSKMVDVEFAEEAQNLTKMQLLVQSSSFALTQANASPVNVYRILQGGIDQKINEFFISAANNAFMEN